MKNLKSISSKLGFFFFSLLILGSIVSCAEQNKKSQDVADFKAGDICSVNNGDSTFGVVKILVIDDSIAHIRIYKNQYSIRPKTIDVSTLSLGSINDTDGFGIGHSPLARKGFEDWQPEVIINKQVTEEELEGYNIWKDQ